MFFLIKATYPIAKKWGVVDLACNHKKHEGEIPITGGISLYLTTTILLILWCEIDSDYLVLLIETGILAITGLIDDKYGLSVKLRFIIEIIIASIMVFYTKIFIMSLGDLLYIGNIYLDSVFAYIFTIIIVVAIINSINMIDGIHGLAASLAICSFCGCASIINNFDRINVVISIYCGSLISFLLFNLQVKKFFCRVFLGDCGSMVIGFLLCWAVILATQHDSVNYANFEPITALFILGLPIIDMVSTILKRITAKRNPLKADRTHIHHIILNYGFSQEKSLLILVLLQCCFVCTGILLHAFNCASYLQFCIYLLIFILYNIDSYSNFNKIKTISNNLIALCYKYKLILTPLYTFYLKIRNFRA